MTAGLCIAIVGAESTGKTVLAGALCDRLAEATGLRCTWIGELLRDWCDSHRRTPRPEEQRAIAEGQAQRVVEAAAAFDIVIADTTPLMTAVYSELLFGDRSLHEMALDHQRRHALTLLTALDLPWVADGLQRDGPHVRAPVDALIREMLHAHRLPWSLVAGSGTVRVENALDAVAPRLRKATVPRRGLFTRLAERNAADRPWLCELCDDPDCEHRSLNRSR